MYRNRKGARAEYAPENKKLEGWLVAVTTVGVVAMLAPGLFVWAKFVDPPADAAVVEAVGRQWHWSYRFPGQDGKLGTVDARHVTDQNPFGMNPDDPNGRDDILVSSPELHLPLGRPVKALLRSIDVLHDFAVPQFRVKMDLVPGLVTYVWFSYAHRQRPPWRNCRGLTHFTMRGKVGWKKKALFRRGYSHPTYAQTLERVAGDAEAGKALYAVCAACHGAQAEGNPTMHAPKLSGQADWYLKRQLTQFKQGARGAHEQDTYGKQMAPMAATLADAAAIDNVVAYIATLPDDPAPATLQQATARGQKLYANCAACHGADARGIQAMNAPRLAGISDWYLVTQLKNFRQGIRGAHPQDLYGGQMRSMAAILTDEQATNDLVAYIGGL
jgi:cytochrome c oxidase subunit 2